MASMTRTITRTPVVWHIRRFFAFPALMFADVWLPDRLIFVSDATRDWVFGAGGRPRACVVRNGVDLDAFRRIEGAYEDVRREFGINSNTRIIGCVGRLDRGKGHDVLLRAVRLVREAGLDAKFVIVGQQYYGTDIIEDLHSLVRDLKIDKDVIFTGFRLDVARLLSSFDIFVSPSEKDAHPRVALEAMAVGLPVVATRSGGIVESVVDGETGLLVPVGDHQSLAEAVMMLLQDPQRMADMGAAALQRAQRLFSAHGCASSVQNIYETLLR
jgi:glycosyltransferase involved in cell wall biosynthesis